MNGGDLIAEVLKARGVRFIFTLCGGHISPILVSCKQRGIRVIDTRHEATAVFAADAMARLTGVPGVAAVTAGPGVTNTMTAVKNAQMAQSPLVLIGGAAPTALQGRGALQDIDQISLFKSAVKWSKSVSRVKDLAPALEKGFRIAKTGTPGPVFLEFPVDLLYEESLVRELYNMKTAGNSLTGKALQFYLNRHVNRMFAGIKELNSSEFRETISVEPSSSKIAKTVKKLHQARRPLLLIGSQATVNAPQIFQVAAAVEQLGIPVYLSGMARGLLGKGNHLQIRHKRRMALKEADLVILAGVPCDFRLDYGNHIRRSAYYVSANLSRRDLFKNRRPNIGILGDPGLFLQNLSKSANGKSRWKDWKEQLRQRDIQRNEGIDQQSENSGKKINPLHLCREIDKALSDDSVLVADGGDFVGTASYILNPRGPLNWLDPGPFGALGVGAGFALSAKLCYPNAEVWIIYGDGSVGFTLSEFDTFVRHQIPVIAVVGNDAGWTQIAREQIEMLKDDVATVLNHSDYHRAVEGFGGVGYLLKDRKMIPKVLQQAKQKAKLGFPVLINAILDKTDFRKGSISV